MIDYVGVASSTKYTCLCYSTDFKFSLCVRGREQRRSDLGSISTLEVPLELFLVLHVNFREHKFS